MGKRVPNPLFLPLNDLPVREPQEPDRNWSLLGRINQTQTRPQDQPCALAALPEKDRALIRSALPELGSAKAQWAGRWGREVIVSPTRQG